MEVKEKAYLTSLEGSMGDKIRASSITLTFGRIGFADLSAPRACRTSLPQGHSLAVISVIGRKFPRGTECGQK